MSPRPSAAADRDIPWLVEELCQSRGQLVLAMGAAGSGKSMLCQHLGDLLTSRQIQPLIVTRREWPTIARGFSQAKSEADILQSMTIACRGRTAMVVYWSMTGSV